MNKTERNLAAIDVGYIRAEVARRGIKQKDLAERLQISEPELSRKVNGVLPFSVCEVRDLALALDCDPGVFFWRA